MTLVSLGVEQGTSIRFSCSVSTTYTIRKMDESTDTILLEERILYRTKFTRGGPENRHHPTRRKRSSIVHSSLQCFRCSPYGKCLRCIIAIGMVVF